MPEQEQERLTLSLECRVGGSLSFSCPSLLDEVEGRGPGDPIRAGGDTLRGGGVDVLIEEMRGEDGPPCGDKGGDCAAGKGFRMLEG
jgi:hypothetical protein